MSLTTVILIILLGLILILLEILVLPGFVVGVVGIMFLVGGIISAYTFLGTTTGHYIFAGTVVCSLVLLWLTFRSNIWHRVSLNTDITGKMNVLDEEKVKAGDIGKTLSRCTPGGKAIINGDIYEVQSVKDFIDQNTEVKVIKVTSHQIIIQKT